MRPSREDVLACLGWRGQKLDDRLEDLLEEAAKSAEALAIPRSVFRKFRLKHSPDGISVEGTNLLLTGTDAAALLEGSDSVYLFCATLGFKLDAAVARARGNRALLLDAAASALIERYCDEVQTGLEASEAASGFHLTYRFAPGYGDLPLGLQKDFLTVLDAGRRIGVQCSESLMLSPFKSVTAVLGVTSEKPPEGSKCSRCPNYPHCSFRKEGTPCA